MTGHGGAAPILYCLNEATALSFAWAALSGRQPVVLAVEPILPPAAGLLDRLADWALRRRRARRVTALCPDLEPLLQYPTRVLLHDVFGELEPWHDAYYRYAEIDRAAPRLAFAYRQVSCNHVRWKHHTLLLIRRVLEAFPAARIVGALPDTAAMAKVHSGARLTPVRLPARLVNTLLAPLLALVALGWALSRVRPRVAPESFFLAADYMSDPRDHEIYDEVAEGGPILLVPREPSRVPPPELAGRYRIAHPRDGLLSVGAFLALLPTLLAEASTIWRRFRHLEPAHFWAMAALPWRRAVLRAFFTRFRPRFFWGRDDYNVEHILRREEIHRIGGRSYGINHGYPAYSIVFPMWRYISFDRYYVFGRALYDRHMRGRWASDMEIEPVGTFGATRAQYPLRLVERPRDIVVFTAVLVGDPAMTAFVRRLAAAFPDRKVLLQVKSTFIDLPEGRAFVAQCTEGLANVVPVRDGMFDLFAKARYSFSDPSTVVVEALQFGLHSFNLDICDIQKVSLLREYPDICVRRAEEAVARIRGIEDGSWRYPLERFADLVDLSGRVIHDVVRVDMGLPAREPARPLPELVCSLGNPS